MAMSENEAIKWLKEMQNPMISEAELYCAETCYGLGKMVYPEPEDYVFETAIKALEEIQAYRTIGTVKDFKHYKHISHIAEIAVESIEKEKKEIRAKAIDEFAEEMKWEYRESIGTSEREIHFALAVIDQVAERLKGAQNEAI